MNIILWILFGAIAGWVSSLIMGRNSSVVGDIILGIIGAFVGGWLATLFGASGVSGFNLYSFIVAILGSILVVWVARFFRRDRTALR
jgi:uncharacterized membrane protein YeaQ/YmgE (transglycosylase-associated protein family)